MCTTRQNTLEHIDNNIDNNIDKFRLSKRISKLRKISHGPFHIYTFESVFDYIRHLIPGVNNHGKILAIKLDINSDYYLSTINSKRSNVLFELIKIHFPMTINVIDLPNLGGASILSEAFSALVSLMLFDVKEIVPEIEIRYTMDSLSKGDHLFRTISSKQWYIVSTTRIYEKMYYKVHKFLYRKICGLCIARDNLNVDYGSDIRMFLHIFCRTNEMCNYIKDVIKEIRSGMFGYPFADIKNVNILIINTNISEIYFDNEQSLDLDIRPTIDNYDTNINNYNELIQLKKQGYNLLKKIKYKDPLCCDFNYKCIQECSEIYRQHCQGRYLENGDKVFSVQHKNIIVYEKPFAKLMNMMAQTYSNISKRIDTMVLSNGTGIRLGIVDNLCAVSTAVANSSVLMSDKVTNSLLNESQQLQKIISAETMFRANIFD